MTLIELIMFIVIVSVGLAGVLAALTTTAKSSADPLLPKQALAIAEGLLEEVLLKGYCDPDTVDLSTTPPTCGTNTVEAWQSFDAVIDFDAVGGGATAINTDLTGTPWPAGYSATVAVSDGTTDLGVPSYRVLVSVTPPNGQAVTLTGYRANY